MAPTNNQSEQVSRRLFLQGAASCLACSLLPGCGYSANPSIHPPFDHPLPGPSVSVVPGSLTVTDRVLGVIPENFLGLSYEKFAISYAYFHTSNHNLIALFRRLGTGVLRLGGGGVDRVLWTAESKGATHDQVTPANIKALAGFLQATGWQCIYGVNLATSTPELAAAEASYAAAALGSHLLGIEVGNEPDEYGRAQSFFPGNWTFADFCTRWQSFHAAIAAAAPGIPVTGPATGGGNNIASWTLPFARSLGAGQVTLLTQHYYRGDGSSPASTAQALIAPDPQLLAELTTLGTGSLQTNIPYRLAECNSFNHGGTPGVSDSYASSLWVIDFLFQAALGNATGVNLHGGGNGPGYTPIADHSGAVIEARPEYYGMLLFSLAGTGTLLETQLAAGAIDATAYTVQNASGRKSIVVVNKDLTRDLTLAVETNQGMTSATVLSMSAASLAATSGVSIQGAEVGTDGEFLPANAEPLTLAGKQMICSIAALSAALIVIE